MNIKKMSDKGKLKTLDEICEGLSKFAHNNPDIVTDLLICLECDLLSPLAEEDFFGTEGWEIGLGIS